MALERPAWAAGAFRRSYLWPGFGCSASDGCGAAKCGGAHREITVEPDGNAGVTVSLPATTDCADEGAICTPDGRVLSNSSTVTVPGPRHPEPGG